MDTVNKIIKDLTAQGYEVSIKTSKGGYAVTMQNSSFWPFKYHYARDKKTLKLALTICLIQKMKGIN